MVSHFSYSKLVGRKVIFNPSSASELWVLAGAIALLIVGIYSLQWHLGLPQPIPSGCPSAQATLQYSFPPFLTADSGETPQEHLGQAHMSKSSYSHDYSPIFLSYYYFRAASLKRDHLGKEHSPSKRVMKRFSSFGKLSSALNFEGMN